MSLVTVEWWVQRAGAVALVVALAAVFIGLARGLPRQQRTVPGWWAGLLRAPLFYAAASVGYFGLCYLIWRPLPWPLSASGRAFSLLLGSLLYFPGLALVLWGRLALGKSYFVSTGLSAQLFTGHELVTSGPYAIIRHPMYIGLLLAAWGSLLIYATWTTAYFAVAAPAVLMRSRREEAALAEEFGEQWQEYCRRVAAFLPRLRRKR